MFFFQKHCEIQSSATQRGFSKRCSFSMVGLGLKVPFGYVNLVRESIEKGSMQVLQISGRYRIKFCFFRFLCYCTNPDIFESLCPQSIIQN